MLTHGIELNEDAITSVNLATALSEGHLEQEFLPKGAQFSNRNSKDIKQWSDKI